MCLPSSTCGLTIFRVIDACQLTESDHVCSKHTGWRGTIAAAAAAAATATATATTATTITTSIAHCAIVRRRAARAGRHTKRDDGYPDCPCLLRW